MNIHMNKITVTCGSYHVFGSGAGSAKLVIDGQRIWPTHDLGHNGFVGWLGAEVSPLALRAARQVHWYKSAIPGGKAEYKGSGKGFLRYMTRNRHAKDPLTVPLMQRPRALALEKERYNRAWLRKRLVEKAAGAQFRLSSGGLNLERRTRQSVRLPDGCKATRFGQWDRVGYAYGYPPAEYKDILGAESRS